MNIYDYGQNADTFGLRMTLGRHDNYVPFDQNVTYSSTALLAEVHRSLRPKGFYFGAQSESASASAIGGTLFAQGYGDNSYSTGLEVLSYSINKTNANTVGEAYGITIDAQSIKDKVTDPGTNRNSYGLYVSAEAPEESKAYAIYSLLGLNYLAGNTGIGQLPGTERLEVSGNIKHTGLVMTTGTNVDQTKSTTFASALTTSWTDVTGVSGTYLATGSYIVQIISNGEYYTGNMSWFSGSTTTTTVDEIELHRAGAAASAARIYARVARVSLGTLKLQVSASASLSSHTMTFTFRRTI
jgi:hypothetical protein